MRGSAVGDRAGGARRNSGWQWHVFGYSRGQLDSTCSDCLCQAYCKKQINTHSAIYFYYDYYYDYYDNYYDYYHYYDYYDHNYYYYDYCYY